MGASKGTPTSRSQTLRFSEDREERRQIKPSIDDSREARQKSREPREENKSRTFAKRKAREIIERKERADFSAPEQDSQEPRSPRRNMIEGGRAERLFERSSQRKNQESIGPYG